MSGVMLPVIGELWICMTNTKVSVVKDDYTKTESMYTSRVDQYASNGYQPRLLKASVKERPCQYSVSGH